MKARKIAVLPPAKSKRPLRVGFLTDSACAPIIVAQELGLFEKYALQVELYKSPSWKHACDHVVHGWLDAAQVGGMVPFLMNLGLLPERAECLVSMILSLQGSSITISHELRRLGVRDARSMREQMWRDRHKKIYLFGVPFPLSSQEALLRQWMNSVTEPPLVQVRIEQVPPSQMFPMLKLGYLDGYCAPEPWGSVAVHAGVGVCVATSAMLAPLHPETVLMVRRALASERAPEHERLIAALIESCAFCDEPENGAFICKLLARSCVNAPRECLEPGLAGPFAPADSAVHSLHGLHIFHKCRANDPSASKAAWITGRLFDYFRWSKRPAGLKGVLRPDLFRRAQSLVPRTMGDISEAVQDSSPIRPFRKHAATH